MKHKAINLEFNPYAKRKYWKTLEDVPIKLSNGDIITVPKGFRWDLSSVPGFLHGIAKPYGKFIWGALIHDWMYVHDYKRNDLGTRKARKLADKEMLYVSDQHNASFWGKIDNRLRYIAVRLFGGFVYKK